MRARGRIYVANMLHIARHSVEGGAGTYLLLMYHFFAMMAMYATWSLLSMRRHNLDHAVGMAEGLLGETRDKLRRILCG